MLSNMVVEKTSQGGGRMRGMNRTQRREMQNMSKKQLLEKLPSYYCQCYDEGVRDSFMAILLKLHDEFNFGNDETLKLLTACEPWMVGLIQNEEIDHDQIKETLINEGITCLESTDL